MLESCNQVVSVGTDKVENIMTDLETPSYDTWNDLDI